MQPILMTVNQSQGMVFGWGFVAAYASNVVNQRYFAL